MTTQSDRLARWAPPAGWRPLPSALEGVVVWGPPEAEVAGAEAPRAVRCGGCGASAAFDPARGAVACAFCGWVDEKRPEVVGDRAPAGEFTAAALAPEAGLGVDRRELACEGCGAVLALDPAAMASTCPFCASNQVAVRDHASSPTLRPGALLPFAVTGQELARKVTTWLGQGWLHPAGLSDLARVDRFVGVYVPYWVFAADLPCTWRAEIGTERTERRWNSDEKRWETETVIDWRWESGSHAFAVRHQLVPGTERLSAVLLGRIEPRFDLSGLATYQPELLAGFQAQSADVGLATGWERGRSKMRDAARDATRASIHERHVRSFSMEADLANESWRHVMLPVWVSAYRYEGRTFVVLVDGRTGAVEGQKPVAWWKVWVSVAIFLSPGLFTALIGLPLLLLGVGAFVLILAVLLLIPGAMASWWVWSTAVASEAA